MSARIQSASRAAMDRAVEWHVLLDSGDAGVEDFDAFTRWLDADPSHRLAYNRVEDLASQVDEARVTASELLDDDREAANAMRTATILPIRRRHYSRLTIRLAAAAAILFAAIATANLLPLGRNGGNSEARYSTALGETRTVTLTDGSTIALNVDTQLAVTESANGRRARLDKGEALFTIAHNAARPFTVRVGDRDIRDVGTVFNVLRHDGRVTVTVAEGAVAVTAADVPVGPNSLRLNPGQQLRHHEGDTQDAVLRVSADDVLGWRRGFVSYENAPLSQVVDDLNRYFGGELVLQNEKNVDLRFSGVLKMDNENSVVQRLTQFLPIDSILGSDGKRILRTRAGGN